MAFKLKMSTNCLFQCLIDRYVSSVSGARNCCFPLADRKSKKEFIVSPANGFLVGILIAIGDVTDLPRYSVKVCLMRGSLMLQTR